MTEQVPFTLRNRNPDVLTCIANLSNDEVFTPPEFANQMLDMIEEAWAKDHDGANIWADPTLRYLDPFTKSGVFLREITTRLVDGLKGQFPDLDQRVDHILTNQVFGIGITQLTSLIARRSLYCSKSANGKHSIAHSFNNEDGNIWFEPTEHTWVGGTEWVITHDAAGDEIKKYTNGKCNYCGAGQKILDRGEGLETHAYAFIHTDDIKVRLTELFGDDMQFDVIIGNPPYQLSDGGGTGSSAVPLYNRFVEQAIGLGPQFLAMVVPARWYSGGKGLDSFRDAMLGDHRLRHLCDYPDSREVFGGVDIAGGVCYFLWDRDHVGLCTVETHVGGKSTEVLRALDEFGVFIRDNRALDVIKKVRSKSAEVLSDLVSPRNPFGIEAVDEGAQNGVFVYASGGDGFAAQDSIGRNQEWVDQWKVLLSKTTSEHAGQTDSSGRRRVFSRIVVMPPGTACTGSYLVVGPFASQTEAEHAADSLRTRFVRYLVATVLLTQNITRGSFRFVPRLDYSKSWSDAELYAEYGLTNEEIELIESTVRSMDPVDE